jgi:hypothetical protein
MTNYTYYCLYKLQGHAIAGGIVFPLAFDYRIMVRGTYKAGLVESAVVWPMEYKS